MSEEDREEKYERSGTRAPTFSGERAKWPFFKTKMESYLARSGLGILLKSTTSAKIKVDDYRWPASTDEEKAAKAEGEKLQSKNQKAASRSARPRPSWATPPRWASTRG